MKLVTTPAGYHFLLIWRTEFLFCTSERRNLAEEWNQVRLTSLPLPETAILINHTLEQPLPFAANSFEAIYSFHAIEHLGPDSGRRFVRDLYRLLKPEGICRISTPDLEFHASEYLSSLRSQDEAPSADHYADYQWAVSNLIDQMARTSSGGTMWALICRNEFRSDYIRKLNGDLLEFIALEMAKTARATSPTLSGRFKRAVRQPALIGRKLASIAQAWFRRFSPRPSYLELSHERNLWFYDRISLGQLFAQAGFQQIEVKDYRSSSIPDWKRYDFDRSVRGDYPLEPSLYMEGVKTP